jgi:hypothetical protein
LHEATKTGWCSTPLTFSGDGDVRKLPQIERKQLLLDHIGENNIEMPVLYSEHLTGDG